MKPSEYIKKGSEYEHQVALFMMCAMNLNKYPELKWYYCIQNEEKSNSAMMGARSKAAGKKAGVPDTHLPVKRGPYSSLYIELKKLKGKGVGPSKEQVEFGEFAMKQGHMWACCYGWEDAVACLEWYLNLT